MKRISAGMMVILFALFQVSGLIAADTTAKADVKVEKKAEAKVKKAPPAPPKPSMTPEQRKALEEKGKNDLASKEWVVTVSPMGGKGKSESDLLTFLERTITSKNLAQDGFPTSNYTLSVSDNGAVTWETMQATEKGEMAFWKGELQDGVMRGVMSKNNGKGASSDYSFTSASVVEQQPAAPVVEAPKQKAPEKEVAPEKDEAVKETSKKKAKK